MTSQSPFDLLITRDLLVAEVRAWARRIGVEDRLKEIHVRPMRRKWASVSTQGRLTLSSDLFKQTAAFRHEVLVHELVHLKLGRGCHNKLFKALVRSYLASAQIPEQPSPEIRNPKDY